MTLTECEQSRNHGYYYTPHLIKAIGSQNVVKKEYTERHYVGIDSQYFEPVINGMQAVVDDGTAIRSKIPGIIMCGKTGTAQNSHGEAHSVFVAFAPRDHPKIAVAVVVENSGEGAHWAAPIASFIVEKYLRGSISPRESGITVEYFENAVRLPDSTTYLHSKFFNTRKTFKADSLKKRLQDSINRRLKGLKSASTGDKKSSPKDFLSARSIDKKHE